MILYIIRHADPDYAHNTITPLGKEEALALGQRMSRVKLDRIYTSPARQGDRYRASHDAGTRHGEYGA